MSNVPKLRFDGFSGEWCHKSLKEVCDYVDYRGKTPNKTDNGIFLVTAKNVKEGYIDYESSKEYISVDDYDVVMHRGKPEIGDVLITTEAPCGNVAQVDRDDIALAQRIIKYRGHSGVLNNIFLKHYLLSPLFQSILKSKSTGGTVQGIKGSVLHQQRIVFPEYFEQKTVGRFLDAIDANIALHQRKCDALIKAKQFYLQNLFPKKGGRTPAIRFDGFMGNWERIHLGDIVERITRKNEALESELPLTISAQYGLIDQREFFDRQIASKDVSGYFLLKRGEFAYNKSTSSDAPWGAVKRLDKYDMGVLSTLYIAFGIKDKSKTCSDYICAYYDTDLWHTEVRAIAAEGARNHGLLNITPSDFFDTELKIPPSYEEQKVIGDFFNSLDTHIAQQNRKLTALKTAKQFLLQNMFV